MKDQKIVLKYIIKQFFFIRLQFGTHLFLLKMSFNLKKKEKKWHFVAKAMQGVLFCHWVVSRKWRTQHLHYVRMREIFGQDLSHSSKYKNKVLNQCVYMHSLILVRNPLFSIYYYWFHHHLYTCIMAPN